MPILQGAVTFARFTATMNKARGKDPRRSLAKDLRAHAFRPLDANGEQERTGGWVELHDSDSTELPPSRFLFEGTLLVAYRIDVRRVPAATVRRALDGWVKDYTTRHGRPPKRAEKSEQKELILKRLRRQAFVTTQTIDVSWNLDTGELLVWSASRKAIDEVHVALEETFDAHLQPRSPGALVEADGLDPARLAPTATLFGGIAMEPASDATDQ